jgi:hypothetical protein
MSYSEFSAIMNKVGVVKGKEYMKRWIAEHDSVIVEVKNPVPFYPVERMLQNPQLNAAYRQSPVLFAALARDCAPIFQQKGK